MINNNLIHRLMEHFKREFETLRYAENMLITKTIDYLSKMASKAQIAFFLVVNVIILQDLA